MTHRANINELYELSGTDDLALRLPATDADATDTITLPIGLVQLRERDIEYRTDDLDVGDIILAFGYGDTGRIPEKDVDHPLDEVIETFEDEHGELIDVEDIDNDEHFLKLATVVMTFKLLHRWILTSYSFELEETNE